MLKDSETGLASNQFAQAIAGSHRTRDRPFSGVTRVFGPPGTRQYRTQGLLQARSDRLSGTSSDHYARNRHVTRCGADARTLQYSRPIRRRARPRNYRANRPLPTPRRCHACRRGPRGSLGRCRLRWCGAIAKLHSWRRVARSTDRTNTGLSCGLGMHIPIRLPWVADRVGQSLSRSRQHTTERPAS